MSFAVLSPMWLLATRAAFVAGLLVALAAAHDDDESMDTGMNMNMHSNTTVAAPNATAHVDNEGPMSYFAYGKHSSTILAHIALMILGWCFVLPAGKQFQTKRKLNQN